MVLGWRREIQKTIHQHRSSSPPWRDVCGHNKWGLKSTSPRFCLSISLKKIFMMWPERIKGEERGSLWFASGNAKETDSTTVKKHWNVERSAELNQPIYMITSEWKEGHVLHWGEVFVFVSMGEEKLWIPIKIRLTGWHLLKILITDMKEETKKNKTDKVYDDPSAWEQVWDWQRRECLQDLSYA